MHSDGQGLQVKAVALVMCLAPGDVGSGGGGSSTGPGEHANLSAGGFASAPPVATGSQSHLASSNSNPPVPSLPVTHELFQQDQWLYKDPQGMVSELALLEQKRIRKGCTLKPILG